MLLLCGFVHFELICSEVLEEMRVEVISSADLGQERSLFVNYWMSEYRNSTLEQLRLDDIHEFLHEVFDQEEQEYHKHADTHFFYKALLHDRLIGYVSFEVNQDRSVYIRQWALVSEYYSHDGLSELLFAVFEHVPDAACLYLVARDVAEKCVELIQGIGFERVAHVTSEYNPALYSCYKIMCADKCGTCMPECDDEDLAYDMLGCGCSSSEEEEERASTVSVFDIYGYYDEEQEPGCGCSAGE